MTAENAAAEEGDKGLEVLALGFVQMKEQTKALGMGKEHLETGSLPACWEKRVPLS